MMNTVKLFQGKGKSALNYMNKHYGEKFNDRFTLVNLEPAGFTSAADNLVMKSAKIQNCFVRVSFLNNRYTTNYIQLQYYQKYQDYMQNLCENILGECKILYDVFIGTDPVYDENTSFEDFLLKMIFLCSS